MSHHHPGQYGPTAASPPQRPGTVTAAAVITIVIGSLFMIVAGIVVLLGLLFMVAAGSAPPEARDVPGVETMLAFGVGALVVVCVLLLAVGLSLIVFSVKAMHGRNWARIVLTVFLAIGVLGSVSDLSRSGTEGNLIGVGLMVLTLVFLWLPSANQWYAAYATYSSGPPPTQPGPWQGTHHTG